jgi:hypothetical protein
MNVLSFGGGVNSTAMLAGILERNDAQLIPALILFADTGGEKPETYAHLELMSAWVTKHLGLSAGITVVREERFTLEQECLSAKTLPSIVTAMRSCSDKFKIRPQNRFMSKWKPALDAWDAGHKVTKLVGFDAGEPWRAKDYSDHKYTVRFPLIEWGWGRDECIAAIERAAIPVPPKSSCFFCPEMREQEIVELERDHPDLLDRALAIERNAKAGKLVRIAGLARTHSWEQVINFHRDQVLLDGTTLLAPRAERTPCVCFDGE